MKTSLLAVVGIIALALAGCRTDPTITLLERENRLLEDEVYRLRGQIQDYETGGTPVNLAAGGGAEAISSEPYLQDSRDSSGPGKLLFPRGKKSSNQALPIPQVEMPNQPLPPGETPDTLKRPAGTPALGEPGRLEPAEMPKQWKEPSSLNAPGPGGNKKNSSINTSKNTNIRPTSGYEPIALDDSKEVGKLVINRMLTGGFCAKGASGDSGLLVVLEPRDAKGRRLDAPGDVAVVLMDPAKQGNQARLARWNFPAAETINLIRGSGIARGMYIECPWPDNPPENKRLHLFVRYTTRDGRKLQADQPIEIALPGENSARWTPAEPRPAYASEIQPASGQSEVETVTAETVAAESDTVESYADDSPPPRRGRLMRSGKIQRPAWTPERF